MLQINSLTHNINIVALSILALLDGEVPIPHDTNWPDDYNDQFHIETSTFYNGRENGICLTVKSFRFYKESLVIVFGENRNSDSIFVTTWLQNVGFNPPQVCDLTDEAYETRRYFRYDAIYPATNYIQELIIKYAKSLLPKEVATT